MGAWVGSYIRERATIQASKDLRKEMADTQKSIEKFKSQLTANSTLTIGMEQQRRKAIIAVRINGLELMWTLYQAQVDIDDNRTDMKILKALEIFDKSVVELELYGQETDHVEILKEARLIKEALERHVAQILNAMGQRELALKTLKVMNNDQHPLHSLLKKHFESSPEAVQSLMNDATDTQIIHEALTTIRDPSLWSKYIALTNESLALSLFSDFDT